MTRALTSPLSRSRMRSYFRNNPRPAGGGVQEGAQRPWWRRWFGGVGGSEAEGFTCEVDENYRSACEGLNFYGEHEGKRYCVLHFPSTAKEDDFSKEIDRKLKNQDFDFAGVYFPGDQSFESCKFSSKATFDKAIFCGEANFHEACFERTASFVGTTFKWTAFFRQAKFNSDAYFYKTRFLERTGFSARMNYEAFDVSGDQEILFDDVEIEKPKVFAFRSIQLRPSWFIYVESAQELTFHEVSWYGLHEGPKPSVREEHDKTKASELDLGGALSDVKAFENEVKALKNREGKGLDHPDKQNIKQPYQLLARTYRRLSNNYEDNREYPIANEFYFWSMNALRMRNRVRFGLINGLYWALSGYGVRARRAFLVLLGIWAAFALLYILVPSSPFSGFSVSDFGEATVYSLGAMARLNPEPKPDPGWFQFLVTVEGLLGPLQIGLLLLAIRRKVMR
jgi:hypothetical protein